LLFLEDVSLLHLSPLLLVFLGAQVLLRGDLVPSTNTRTFGITRGSVESATLTLNSGEIDVRLRAFPPEMHERLVIGQYASQARPELELDGTHAHLTFDRAKTSWFTFADWDIGLSPSMPWSLLLSTSLGQLDVDLANVIVQDVRIHSGIGDVRIVAPRECLGEGVQVRSILGNIQWLTPEGYRVEIVVPEGRFSKAHVDTTRYERLENGAWSALSYDESLPVLKVELSGQFGDVYLA
jgi:hypothetical protein